MIRRAQNYQTIKEQFFSKSTFDFFGIFVQEQSNNPNYNVSKISYLKNMFEQYKFLHIVNNQYKDPDNESNSLKIFFNEIKNLFDLNYSDDTNQVLDAIKNSESTKKSQLQKYKNLAKQLAQEKQKFKSDNKSEKQEILQLVRDIKSKNVELQQQNSTLQFRLSQIEQEQKASENFTKVDDKINQEYSNQQYKQKTLFLQQQIVFRDRTIRELLKVIKYYEVLQPNGFKGFEQFNQIKTESKFNLKKLKQKLISKLRSNSPFQKINFQQSSDSNLNSIISNEDEYKQLSDVILRKKIRNIEPLDDECQNFDDSEKRKLLKMYILYFKNIYKQNENEIQIAIKKLQQHDSQIGTEFQNILQDYKEFQQVKKQLENNNKNEWEFDQQQQDIHRLNFDFQTENNTEKQSIKYQEDPQFKTTVKVQQQKNILQLYSKDLLNKDNIIQQQNFKIFQLQNQQNNQNYQEFKVDKQKLEKQNTLNEQLKSQLKTSQEQVQQLLDQIKSNEKKYESEKKLLNVQIQENEKILKDLENLVQQQKIKLDQSLKQKQIKIEDLQQQIQQLNQKIQEQQQKLEKQNQIIKQQEQEINQKIVELKNLKDQTNNTEQIEKDLKQKIIFLYKDCNKKMQNFQNIITQQQNKTKTLKEFINQGKLLKNMYQNQGSKFQEIVILCFKKLSFFQEQINKIQVITQQINETYETKLIKLSTLVKRNMVYFRDIEKKFNNLCSTLNIQQNNNFQNQLDIIIEREEFRKISEPFLNKYFIQKDDYDQILQELQDKLQYIQSKDNKNILQSNKFKFLISMESYFEKIKIYDQYCNEFQKTPYKQIWTQQQFSQKLIKILILSTELQNHFNPSNQDPEDLYLINENDRDNYIKMMQGNEEISHIYQQTPIIDDYAQSLQDILQKRLKEQLEEYKVLNQKSYIINDTATTTTISQKKNIEKLNSRIAELEEALKNQKISYKPMLHQNNSDPQNKKSKDDNQKKYIQEVQKKLNYYKDFLRVFDLNPKDPNLTENFFKKLQELRIDYSKLNLEVFDQKKLKQNKKDKEKKNDQSRNDILEDFLNEKQKRRRRNVKIRIDY